VKYEPDFPPSLLSYPQHVGKSAWALSRARFVLQGTDVFEAMNKGGSEVKFEVDAANWPLRR
jgi:hypothetical protein